VTRPTKLRLAAAAALLALAPWLALALLSAPSFDDFCFFALTRAHGWAGAQQPMYDGHFGRFVATALLTGLGWATDRLGGLPGPFPALPLIAIAAVLWFCWRTLGRLLPGQKAGERAVAAGLTGALFLAAMPGAGEILYWGSGMACYLPLILFLWHLVLRIADAFAGEPPPRAGEVALLAVLGFLVAGTQELGAPLILLLLAGWAWAGRRQGWAAAACAALAAVALPTLAAFAIVYAAPGNDVRSAFYPGSHELLRALPMTVVDAVIFLTLRIAAVPALAGGLALLWLAAARHPPAPRLPAALPRLLLALWAMAVLGTGLISRYAINHALPPRGLDVTFTLGVLALAFAAVRHGGGPGAAILAGWSPERRRAATAGALLLCAAGAGEWRVLYQAAATAPRAAAEYRARLALLAAAAPGSPVAVPPLRVPARPLQFMELSPDPTHWHNRCVADYFGLAAVIPAGRAAGG
jgi:hypothetical protein